MGVAELEGQREGCDAGQEQRDADPDDDGRRADDQRNPPLHRAGKQHIRHKSRPAPHRQKRPRRNGFECFAEKGRFYPFFCTLERKRRENGETKI